MTKKRGFVTMEKLSRLLERLDHKLDEEFEEFQRSELKKGVLRGALFIGILMYLELIFHLFVFHKVDRNLVNGLVSSAIFGVFITIITGLFSTKVNRWIGRGFVCVITAYYVIQKVYYSVFWRFLSIYSLGAVGTDVLQFSGEVWTAVANNIVPILLLLVPILVLFCVKGINYDRDRWCVHSIFIFSGLILYITFLVGLKIQGTQLYSAYNLYHYNWIQDLGVEKLGLINSAAKDMKGLILGSGKLELETVVYEDVTLDSTTDSEVDSKENVNTDEDLVKADGNSDGSEVGNNESEVGGSVEGNGNGVGNNGSESGAGNGASEGSESGAWNGAENGASQGSGNGAGNSGSEVGGNVVGNGESEGTVAEAGIDKSPNILTIDFEQLILNEKNDTIKKLHTYFASQTPTNKNEYTGMFAGYNLILITAEGFSPWAVDENITPTLYKLTHEGFLFNNFYTPLWWSSTSDGEYVACTSTIPKGGVISMYVSGKNDMPFCLGNQLGKLNYDCYAYHNHTYTYYHRDVSHPNMGYQYKGVGNGLEVTNTWPESDYEMMVQTIPEYIDQEPFHAYYMTVSGHMNYTFIGNSMSYKNRDAVKDLPYSEEAKAYIACNVELDRALEYLIQELEKAGVAKKTVIALSADHYPYGLEKSKIDEIAGYEVEDNFEIYKNYFILWNAGMKEPIVIDKPCSSLDILPTISNLFGIDYDSRLLMGKDILSDARPLVMFSNRSFITDQVMYNSTNGEITKLTENELSEKEISNLNKIVKNKFMISSSILEENYYSYLRAYIKPNEGN